MTGWGSVTTMWSMLLLLAMHVNPNSSCPQGRCCWRSRVAFKPRLGSGWEAGGPAIPTLASGRVSLASSRASGSIPWEVLLEFKAAFSATAGQRLAGRASLASSWASGSILRANIIVISFVKVQLY
ncbi:hypothetical protein ACQJBY_037658 [Aegilops geniculata]